MHLRVGVGGSHRKAASADTLSRRLGRHHCQGIDDDVIARGDACVAQDFGFDRGIDFCVCVVTCTAYDATGSGKSIHRCVTVIVGPHYNIFASSNIGLTDIGLSAATDGCITQTDAHAHETHCCTGRFRLGIVVVEGQQTHTVAYRDGRIAGDMGIHLGRSLSLGIGAGRTKKEGAGPGEGIGIRSLVQPYHPGGVVIVQRSQDDAAIGAGHCGVAYVSIYGGFVGRHGHRCTESGYTP